MSERDAIDRGRLAEAIADLPESEKLIARLLWYEAVELGEAAERLGISPEEAAALQQRAMTRVSVAGREPGPARTD